MGEITNFVVKGFEIEEEGDRRIVKGHITADVVDKQGEYVAIDEVYNVMKTYMSIRPLISDWHSNRMVGEVLDYQKSEIEGKPSVYIKAEVFKHPNVTLYDQVWEKVKKGKYCGFSLGGASKEKKPIIKDGKLAMGLNNLELYEIALCPNPINPLAVIDYVNDFAKASGLDIKENDGRQRIQCNGVVCTFDKAYGDKDIKKDHVPGMTDEEEEKRGIGTNEPTTKREKVDTAIKSDYTLNVTVDTDKLQELVKSTIENFVKQYMPFNKPIRGHSWEYWQKKLKEDNPDYTDEDVDATIASWEKEEKAKKGYKKSNEETENEDAKQEPDKQTKKLEAEKEQYKIDKALVDDLVQRNQKVVETLS